MTSRVRTRRPPRGFTLLEIILALALTAFVMAGIAMVIDLHLRAVDSGRSRVEEALLARAILHRIADDLRGTIPHDPLNADQTMQMSVSAEDLGSAMSGLGRAGGLGSTGGSSMGGTGGSLASAAGGTGGTTGGSSNGSSAATEGATQTSQLAESLLVPPVVGLFGDCYALQIDVSRLPRLDQFLSDVSLSPDALTVDRLSDLKTVAYYVITPESSAVITTPLGTEFRSGLVRRELDRAVTVFAADSGTLDSIEANIEPLAPEVAAIEFAYFDGLEWLDYWDSREMGGLPLAVRVTIGIIPREHRSWQTLPWRSPESPAAWIEQPLLTYSLVICLPAARPASVPAGSGSSEATGQQGETGSGQSGSSGSTGSPGGSGTQSPAGPSGR